MRKKIIKQCLKIARYKNAPDYHPQWGFFHHFSFIIQNNKIVEYGFNRSGPPLDGFGYNKKFGKIHSENDAYRKAKGLLDPQRPFDIVNIRLNKQGEMRLSKPCNCCHNFLSVVNCHSVYFSTKIGFAKINL